MKIYIAKHYWKDKKSATWECHEKIDKELFEYLKNNYHKFVIDKPKMIKQNKQFIYLCYEEGKDNYARTITEITFFVVNRPIENNFCKIKYKNLEVSLASNKKILWSVGIILILLGIVGLSILNKNDKDKQPADESLQKLSTFHYKTLVKDWNDKLLVSEKQKFALDEFNNTKVILKLNEVMKKSNKNFNEEMNEDEIRKLLKEATHEKVMSRIVKKVLMMNDMERREE